MKSIRFIPFCIMLLVGLFTTGAPFGCRASKKTGGHSTSSSDRKPIHFQNAVHVDYLKTVLFHHQDNQLLPPFLALNSPASLVLRFDDLRGGFESYAYRIEHCDVFWAPSELRPSEYLRGFQELSITEIEQGFNVRETFTHYAAQWPNDMSAPLLSGNYLLTVYNEASPDEPLITRRLVVYEQLVNIVPDIKASSIVSQRRHKQEVDFTIQMPGFRVNDPARDLEVYLLQNNRWDNAIFGLKPVFYKGSELVYDFQEENNFDGLNEFRWFDTKGIRFAAMGTDSIRDGRRWQVHLTPARRRTYEAYSTEQDINGNFLIRNDDFDDHLESDYVDVHFYFPVEQELPGAQVHVQGAMTDYRLSPQTRMQWNPKRRWYELTLRLKQGYYNYQINIVTPDRLQGDATLSEGNHQVTENQYTLFAYAWDPLGYDRVIGAVFTNSRNP